MRAEPSYAAALTPAGRHKRLNINLSEAAYQEIRDLASATRRSITELVRLGLSLARVALEESSRGNKLIVTTGQGQPIKELVLPR